MATLRLDQTHGSAASLSGVASIGDYLFLAPDEGASLLRLKRLGLSDFGQEQSFAVADFVEPPGSLGDELDLEGLDGDSGALWVVGSHGAVRTRVHDDDPAQKIPATLAKVRHPVSRTLLARIPLGNSADGPVPLRSDESGGAWTSAACLPVVGKSGYLVDALRDDEHLGPFLDLPSKDNGLDIEGLALAGERVLLGLRGPVLRGWAVILEVAPRCDRGDPTRMELAVIDELSHRRYRKHFVDLGGLGIRDLARDGDDLLILAGPTMLLDGPSRVLRLRGAAMGALKDAVHAAELEFVAELAVGTGEDHPEAIAVLRDGGLARQLLVAYDSPAASRLSPVGITAEVIALT